MAHSFGLILANRAVVLGAVKVSDLLALSAEATPMTACSAA